MKAIIFDYNRTLFDPEAGGLFPGVDEILGNLKPRFKLALVAKGDAERVKQIDQLGLRKYFEVIIIGKEKGEDDYRKCIEQLQVRPAKAYLIGDRIVKEIKFGNAIGAVTVWFRNGKFKDELPKGVNELPAYTIEDLKDLLEILK
ncbi:HAD hydrolase-like protein [Candidatus Woesearchaeota archaeon]|nr:HAD hydrolase-like protein [Candidatus Woesearchaeota archaeon]